jgi:hypothetical protein
MSGSTTRPLLSGSSPRRFAGNSSNAAADSSASAANTAVVRQGYTPLSSNATRQTHWAPGAATSASHAAQNPMARPMSPLRSSHISRHGAQTGSVALQIEGFTTPGASLAVQLQGTEPTSAQIASLGRKAQLMAVAQRAGVVLAGAGVCAASVRGIINTINNLDEHDDLHILLSFLKGLFLFVIGVSAPAMAIGLAVENVWEPKDLVKNRALVQPLIGSDNADHTQEVAELVQTLLGQAVTDDAKENVKQAMLKALNDPEFVKALTNLAGHPLQTEGDADTLEKAINTVMSDHPGIGHALDTLLAIQQSTGGAPLYTPSNASKLPKASVVPNAADHRTSLLLGSRLDLLDRRENEKIARTLEQADHSRALAIRDAERVEQAFNASLARSQFRQRHTSSTSYDAQFD